MGFTICSFSGKNVLKQLEDTENSERLVKDEQMLPIGELQPLLPPSDSAPSESSCSFLFLSA